MKAIAMHDYGSPLELIEFPTPTPAAGEVLVAVRASSINGFDTAVAAGYLKGMMDHQFPVIIGKDFAGTIAALGEGSSRFASGDRVFGVVMRHVLSEGSFADYVTSPENFAIAKLPEGVSFEQAGALGLAGTAALQALDSLELLEGDTVLISGATGGVGAYAIQLALGRGLRVIATAQVGEEERFVRSLGAAETVDYTGDLKAAVRALRQAGVDGALHLAGDPATLADVVKTGGRIASLLGLTQDQLGDRDVKAIGVMATPDPATLDFLAAEVAAGRLVVPTAKSYSLADAPQAIADFAAARTGKLAITVGA